MSNKPFFYRIDAGKLLDFATDPDGENVSLMRFAKDLIKGESEIEFIQEIIDEAHGYMEKKREAGKLGGLAKASSAKAKASSAKADASTALAKPSTPLARSSSSNRSSNRNKEKEDNKKSVHGEFENVLLSEDEFSKLKERAGEKAALETIEKLSEYMKSKGKKYSSHYATVLGWLRREGKLDAPEQQPPAEKKKDFFDEINEFKAANGL